MVRKTYVIGLALVVLFGISLSVYAGGQKETPKTGATKQLHIAALFPGSIQDADYNAIGYIALQDVAQQYGLKSSYSQQVAVPDAERVMREYANNGANIVWAHGSQFDGAALKVAPDYPKITFIVEVDSKPASPIPNVWYIDRNFYTGFYVLGALAGLKTQTGKIGYLGGQQLPFTRGEINAVLQGLKEVHSTATLEHVYVGNFNDPVATRQAAESMISGGVDVILSSVNLGNYGLYNAVKEAKHEVFFTAKYTDKENQAPNHYLTSDLFNFKVPINAIIKNIIDGQKGGYYFCKYGKDQARFAQFPIKNVSAQINSQVLDIANKVASGELTVVRDQQAIPK